MHARSERLPDVYETSRNWTYFTQYDAGEIDHLGRTAASLTRVAVSPDDLEPEVFAQHRNRAFLQRLQPLSSRCQNCFMKITAT